MTKPLKYKEDQYWYKKYSEGAYHIRHIVVREGKHFVVNDYNMFNNNGFESAFDSKEILQSTFSKWVLHHEAIEVSKKFVDNLLKESEFAKYLAC